LHPYKLIKDTRTQVETSQVEAVLDGDLDQFIEAELVLQ
ncbi:MAG TPA: peptide chain release factor 2, partial [Candidatus Woesebacteria bacterium]|nr:peptide chain release factor 2 [Candidatus Woesebacteria bacterium]